MKPSENFKKKIAFEMARMSTRCGQLSGNSKNMEKIKKKNIHGTEREELDFTEKWTCVGLIIERLCQNKILGFNLLAIGRHKNCKCSVMDKVVIHISAMP